MFLYLVQHGEARREEEDPARGLTEKGVDDIWKAASLARKMGIHVASIFHSGKTRALQTAQILADLLQTAHDASETDNLAPMDDPALWAGRLRTMTDDIMLVGHLPHLAKLAGLLLSGNNEQMIVNFTMGGIVCLKRFDDGRWAVEWIALPGMGT